MHPGPQFPPHSPASLRSRAAARRLRTATPAAAAQDSVTLAEPTAPTPHSSTAHLRIARGSSPSNAPSVASSGVAATSVNIAELKRKTVLELHDMADSYAIENPGGLKKQELIFRIEQK